jgi:hypothetical protein
MKNKEITSDQITINYDYFTNYLIPFGSMDIRRAVEVALEVDEDGEWAAKQAEQFAEDIGTNIKDCDPVSSVYDTILQEARNEIDNLIGFDFCNDGADVYTAGNFCATSYDWSDNAPEKIKDKLIENEIDFNDLSIKTQWFLNQIEANY